MIGRKFNTNLFTIESIISIGEMLDDDFRIPSQVDDYEFKGDPKCKTDHGERTNPKLLSQPFYHRSSNGKMRSY